MEKKIYSVSGMKCPQCEKNVENAVKAIAGVKCVRANHLAGNISVEYDESNVSPDEIKTAVDGAGSYELTL